MQKETEFQVTHQSIHEQLSEKILTTISWYTVYLHGEKGSAKPVSLGSGILMSYTAAEGTVRGIMTAAHVADSISKFDNIGVLIRSKKNNFKIKSELLSVIRICDESGYGESGPDLAFIGLSEKDAGVISAYKSFLKFPENIGRIEKCDEESGVFVVMGFPELKRSESMRDDQCIIESFGQAILCEKFERRAEDVLAVSVPGKEHEIDLETYAGMSGGGVWKLRLKGFPEKLEISDFKLCGIMFYQTPEEEGQRWMLAHDYILMKRLFDEADQSSGTGANRTF